MIFLQPGARKERGDRKNKFSFDEITEIEKGGLSFILVVILFVNCHFRRGSMSFTLKRRLGDS